MRALTQHRVQFLGELRRDSRATDAHGDSGFTLIELIVTMLIASTLMSIGAFGFTNWQHTSQQRGTAQELVSALRNTAQRSVSEGRTYCVRLGAQSYVVFRGVSCITGTVAPGGARTASAKVSLNVPPTGAGSCPAAYQCIYFYPRGTASPATVNVTSNARSKVYTITVEGLTARVYI